MDNRPTGCGHRWGSRRAAGDDGGISVGKWRISLQPLEGLHRTEHTQATPGPHHPPNAPGEAERPLSERPSQGAPSGAGAGAVSASRGALVRGEGRPRWVVRLGCWRSSGGTRRTLSEGCPTRPGPRRGSPGRRPERRAGSGQPVTRGFVALGGAASGVRRRSAQERCGRSLTTPRLVRHVFLHDLEIVRVGHPDATGLCGQEDDRIGLAA